MLPEWLTPLGAATPAPTHGTSTVWREACLESRPVLLAPWLVAQSQPVLILTPSLPRAEQWLAVLLRLGLPEHRLLRAPSSLTPLLEPTGVEQETLHERLHALHALYRGEAVCVIAPVAAALQRTMPPALFESELVRLRLPDAEPPDAHDWQAQIAPDALLRRLAEDGYEYQEPVRLPGRFARRGGIVDVFPMGAEMPVRIEFWGDEIASLRLFEPATQRSTRQIKHIALPPAREVPMGSEPVATRIRADWETRIARQPAVLQPTLRQNLEDDLRPLLQGAPFDRLELYLPWLLDARACLLDYLPDDGWLILDEPLMLNTACDRAVDELRQSLESRAARGDIPPLSPDEYLEPFERIERARASLLLGDPIVAGGRPLPADHAHELGARALRTATGTVGELWQRVYRWHQAGYRIVVATDRPTQVRKALQEAALEGSVELFQGNLGGGFVWDAQQFALLTDGELFENRRLRLPPRRFNEGVPIASIMDLQPGDYVVHLYHGVGVFRGLTTLERDGVKREYLLIEYAHPDRIFVPVDQLDRIQKYLAPDDKPPEVKRLNSMAWTRTVARARQKAKEVAEELVRIYALRERATRPPYGEDTPWQAEMEAMFPYLETEGQLRAIAEVKADLESPHPMDRLLIGDVGFGKTEVALRAAFKAIMAGRQVALLCPTTILAYQHYQTFKERFEPFGAQVALLSRLISPAEQKRILHGLKTGAVDMVIGTHRLLSSDVQFHNLGLVIIDEEQRFGVMQKERFKKLRGTVDVLSMSATPIPRTLYMALTEIRDMSMITDPPPGRLPIRTVVAPYTDWMAREAILRELQRDGQVFYVVPRIQGITHTAERLQKLVPHARIAVAHGQMPPQEVEATVLAFYNREYDVLVSTTIIENGLDMPNVNTLLVEGAERFGLGQLYQLRGRVGRSDRQAYAYFLYRAGKLTEKAEDRLQALREFSHLGSGFALAMRDLEIRGAGNLLGEEQHGAMRSVGLELYQAMLRDAIRRLRKGETDWSLDSPVEEELPDASQLPIHAYIPHDYIQDVAQRLGYYKRIAGSRTREELKALVRELRDRYGELPLPLKSLIRLMEQRILAHALGVQRIGVEGKRLALRFKPERKLKARWQLALQQAVRGVRTQPDEISAPLGDHPLETLMLLLSELKACMEA
ncbi:MAG: transcription-repair coupling factor [Fimbriimonadales bacterium]|nr:MAG: transcription-repair-coupling factor [Fimbriimonadales bacterium]